MGMIENKFNEDMKDIYFAAKRELGYNAKRYKQLVSEVGKNVIFDRSTDFDEESKYVSSVEIFV